MRKSWKSRWVWYVVLIAVVAGFFMPAMVALAGPVELRPVPTCKPPETM